MNIWTDLANQIVTRIGTVEDAGPAHPRWKIPTDATQLRQAFTATIDGQDILRGWIVAPGSPVSDPDVLGLGMVPYFEESLGFRVRGLSRMGAEDSFDDFLDVARAVQLSIRLWNGWDVTGAKVETESAVLSDYVPRRMGDATVWSATIDVTLRVTHQMTFQE